MDEEKLRSGVSENPVLWVFLNQNMRIFTAKRGLSSTPMPIHTNENDFECASSQGLSPHRINTSLVYWHFTNWFEDALDLSPRRNIPKAVPRFWVLGQIMYLKWCFSSPAKQVLIVFVSSPIEERGLMKAQATSLYLLGCSFGDCWLRYGVRDYFTLCFTVGKHNLCFVS